MEFIPASAESLAAFVVVLAVVFGSFLAAVWWAGYRTQATWSRSKTLAAMLGSCLWLGGLALGIASGMTRDGGPERILIFFFLVNAVSLGAALSPLGRLLCQHIPVSLLVAFQGFRFPLELILHSWAKQGTIPMTMTWSGNNVDIISGALALILAPFVGRRPALAWLVNLLGLLLLFNVMRVAMLSSPLPFAWGTHPPLLLALYLPYALIAPICVGGALFGHIVLTRALLARR